AYGGEGTDVAESVRQANDGGYIVTGRTKSFGAVGYDLWVLKLRPDGDIEWQKTYGGVNQDDAHSVQQTIDGGYVVAGEAGERPADISWADAWVLKLGPDGTVEWQKTYGGVDHETARSIQQTRERGYVVAGSTGSFLSKGSPGLWVLKLKPDGSIGPSCDFIRDTSISGKDSSATAKTTSVSPKDSGARPQDSQATTQNTNALTRFLCP
ncbi:MAG: hypothetical protein QMD05_08670, partial [Candidatus Brocadiaceae bacterium]|nr:hypothetical protein [Candidatus Brocadiaceae bacterium]